MKLKDLSCPNCGGNIDIDIGDRKTMFCPYCGSQFSFSDDTDRNITITIQKRITDDAEIERIKWEKEKDRRETIGIIIMLGFVVIGNIILFFL